MSLRRTKITIISSHGFYLPEEARLNKSQYGILALIRLSVPLTSEEGART